MAISQKMSFLADLGKRTCAHPSKGSSIIYVTSRFSIQLPPSLFQPSFVVKIIEISFFLLLFSFIFWDDVIYWCPLIGRPFLYALYVHINAASHSPVRNFLEIMQISNTACIFWMKLSLQLITSVGDWL